MSTTAWVTHRFAAFHRWPDAPAGRNYLGVKHRHLFHVRAEVEVSHDDRDIEFHDLLDHVVKSCNALGVVDLTGTRNLYAMSCEMIARHVAEYLRTTVYPGRAVRVEVSEDGECGARVELEEVL